MSHIVEFEVEGLAGRKNVYKQKLNRDVNLFFGLNGSGKTSLLKILNAVLDNDATSLAVVPFTKAIVTIYSVKFKKKFTYTLDKQKRKREDNEHKRRIRPTIEMLIHERKLEEEAELIWEIEPETPEARGGGGWLHEYLPTTRLLQMGYRLSPETSAPIRNEESLDMNFELALKNYWSDFFGEIQKNVRQLQQKALVDILHEVLTTKPTKSKGGKSLDWETAYEEMVTFLKRQNPRARPSSKKAFSKRYGESILLRKVIALIDRVERESNVVMSPRTKLQNLIERMFSGGKKVKFEETSIEVMTENKKNIGLRTLSSGEKHILYILIECLRADISSIIIDEPEISMHVDWQHELISAMRELNPKAQIIAATHSPEILADIDDSKIFKL